MSFNAYENDIREIFDDCGNITNVKLLTKPDGKPRGLAFVKFSSKNSFNKALELNGIEHMTRTVAVEIPENKGNQQGGKNNNRNQGGQGGQRSQGGRQNNDEPANIETPTLFIGGLSYNSTNDSIKEYFSIVGEVQSARVVTDRDTGKVNIYNNLA